MASKLFIDGKQLTGIIANALKINCKDKNGNKSTVQAELNKLNNEVSEQNNKLEPIVLWENNNPSASFGAQTLNIDWSSYKRIGVFAYYNNTNDVCHEFIFHTFLGNNKKIFLTFTSMYHTVKGREVTFGDNTIVFTEAKTGGSTTENTSVIPYKIIGYKY